MSSQEYKIRTFVMPDGNSFTFKDFEIYQDVQAFPATGSSSIIYLDATSSLLYYWTGAGYSLFSFAPKESPNFTGSIKLGNTRPTIGTNSVALGSGALASGNNSVALGSGNATGAESVALGSGCQAAEARSFAQGEASRATASCAIALGGGTTASAYGAFAEGVGGTASGYASHKEGYGCYVTQEAAHAEGRGTRANGAASHTEGQGTVANGVASHVGGMCNIGDSYSNWPEWVANTSYSVGDKVKVTNATTVTGYVCKTANSDSSFTASNWDVDEKMNYAEIIGNGTADNARSNARSLDWNGNEYLKGDLYVGCNSDSTGGTKVAKLSDVPDASSFAPKASPVFTGSISLGRNTPSTVGTGSIAVGTTNTASGQYSQAYGDSASATAQGAYASGYYASASGSYSHAEGGSTTANHAYQHVFGTFNNSDPSSNVATSKGTYVEIVGNGTGAVSPSNARALDWNGNEYLKGDIYVGCNAASSNGSKVATESFVTTNITSLNQAITSANEAIATESLGNLDSLSALQTALATLNGTISNNQFRNITFGMNNASGLFASTVYLGTLIRFSSTRFRVEVGMGQHAYSDIIGSYNGGTWEWYSVDDAIATKENHITLSSGSLLTTIDNLTANNSVIIYVANSSVADIPISTRGVALVAKSGTDERGVIYQSVHGEVYINNRYGAGWTGWKELAPMPKNGSNDKASATSIATGVSLNQLLVSQVGKLVGVVIEIATTAQIAANTNMFTGCPASGINSAVVYGFNNTNSSIVPFLISTAGQLINKEAIPSGASIRISQTYTAA